MTGFLTFVVVILTICVFVLFSKTNATERKLDFEKKRINDILRFIRDNPLKEKPKEAENKATEKEAVEEVVPVVINRSEPIVQKSNFATKFFDDEDEGEPQVFRTTPPAGQAPAQKPPQKPMFNSENWVGMNLINRIGALLIVLGAIFTAGYDGFPAMVRTIILFSFALVVLGLGEFMNRKKANTVALGVSASGVGLLYVALAASYFGLHTMEMYGALATCIIISALGLWLAIRYKAEVIGCFALIGGYMPIFAINPSDTKLLYGLIVYFLILSVFTLIISMGRKWSFMNFIGLLLTIIGTCYIGAKAEPALALVYSVLAFLIYTAVPLASAYNSDRKFSELDALLVIINTFVSSIVIFWIADKVDVYHIHAYLCLTFALIYAGVAAFVKKTYENKVMETIFTLTSLLFVAIFVPFYFDKEWFALAWMVEAGVIAIFGIEREKKLFEASGLVILVVSAFALLINDLAGASQFTMKYSFFTFIILAIMSMYIYKERGKIGWGQVFKFFALANFWVYILYLMKEYGGDYKDITTLCAIASFVLAFAYAKLPIIKDMGTKILGLLVHIAGLIALWIANFDYASSISYYADKPLSNPSGLIFNLLALIVAFGAVLWYIDSEKEGGWYKNINLVNLWAMIGFIIHAFYQHIDGIGLILCLYTFAYAFIINRIGLIKDYGTKIISIFMNIGGIVALWIIGYGKFDTTPLRILATVTGTVAMFALADIIKQIEEKKTNSAIKIVILSAYFLLLTTQALLVQTNMAFDNAIISIMYAAASFAWIAVGFIYKSPSVRKVGLALSFSAVAKLLIVDTWGLSTGIRIISFISCGIILMLISWLYQKFSKTYSD